MDGATGVRYEYVTREIGVPVCTLTAEDCEAHWRKLVQKLPLSGRRIDIKVPCRRRSLWRLSVSCASTCHMDVP